jgi:hypothetical protein
MPRDSKTLGGEGASVRGCPSESASSDTVGSISHSRTDEPRSPAGPSPVPQADGPVVVFRKIKVVVRIPMILLSAMHLMLCLRF